MKAYERDIPSYSVCIRSLGEYVFDRIPTMDELYASLTAHPEYSVLSFMLSDLFSKGFVYKPQTFDTPHLSTKEEYRLFKVTKNAKYIEKAILESLSSPEDLILLLKDKIIKVCDSHIYSTLTGFSSPFSRIIETAEKNPVQTKIKKDSLLEFYIKSECTLSELSGKELCINGHSFAVESVNRLQEKNAPSALLLAPLKTDSNSKELPAKAFRLGYNPKNNLQFFLPGSVFESFTPKLQDKIAPFLLDCNI